MIEAAQGLGLLIGPPFGSLLNYYGGYKCPFYSFGKYLGIIFKYTL